MAVNAFISLLNQIASSHCVFSSWCFIECQRPVFHLFGFTVCHFLSSCFPLYRDCIRRKRQFIIFLGRQQIKTFIYGLIYRPLSGRCLGSGPEIERRGIFLSCSMRSDFRRYCLVWQVGFLTVKREGKLSWQICIAKSYFILSSVGDG